MEMYSWLLVKPLSVLLSIIITVTGQKPVFIVNPVSVTAIDGTTVEFTCTATNTEEISYRVNRTLATLPSVRGKGFKQHDVEELGHMLLRINLTVTVSSLYNNNTEIYCNAQPNDVKSLKAILKIQGSLPAVKDSSSYMLDSSTYNISWSPPFTLPGTAIIGYNITVINNGTTTNYFTSDSYYVLQLSNITDSPCDAVRVTITGYNGLDGEPFTLQVPPSNAPLTVKINKSLRLSFLLNITDVCVDEDTISDIDITLFRNGVEVCHDNNATFLQDSEISSTPVNCSFTVEEDQTYKAKTSFSIWDGDIAITSVVMFNTSGVKSYYIDGKDRSGVLCRCVFNSYSTDIGCTVQLLSIQDQNIMYESNFTKNGTIATGYIAGVATGLYLVKVFDQGNSAMFLSSELNVTEEPFTTSSSSTLSSSTTTSSPQLSTSTSTPETTPSVKIEKSSNTVLIAAAVLSTGVVIIILLVLVACFVWQRIKQRKNRAVPETSTLNDFGTDFVIISNGCPSNNNSSQNLQFYQPSKEDQNNSTQQEQYGGNVVGNGPAMSNTTSSANSATELMPQK